MDDRIISISENLYKIEKKYNKKIKVYKDNNYKDLTNIYNWIIEEYNLYIFIYPIFDSEYNMFWWYELYNLNTRKKIFTYKEFEIIKYTDVLSHSIDETLKYILNNYDTRNIKESIR